MQQDSVEKLSALIDEHIRPTLRELECDDPETNLSETLHYTILNTLLRCYRRNTPTDVIEMNGILATVAYHLNAAIK